MAKETRNAETLARALGGKRSGRQWLCPCPAHDDAHPSLLVFDGHDKVQVRCQAGCDPVDVLRAINALTGGFAPDARADTRAKADDNREAEQHAAMALRIWREAIGPGGTMAEAYLKKRGLVLPDGEPQHVIRFHPSCPRGSDRRPALVALMRDVRTDQPRAIQRIYLDALAHKDGAMMLGPAGGCAIKITSHWHTFWDDLNFCPRLHVCEGFETGLALAMRGYTPIWALGSAGAIERFPALFGVGELVICADNDQSGTGVKAAQVCAASWNATTHQRARIWLPDLTGKDFADNLVGGNIASTA